MLFSTKQKRKNKKKLGKGESCVASYKFIIIDGFPDETLNYHRKFRKEF